MNPNYDRAILFHLHCDHRAMHEAVKAAEGLFAALVEAPGPLAHLRSELEALRERLERHFREEEEGGCLEEAVCRCPGLAPELRRIEQEHPALLSDLDEVIRRLAARRPGEPLDALRAGFDEFVRRLHAHETAEDRVLEKGLNVNMEMELEQLCSEPEAFDERSML